MKISVFSRNEAKCMENRQRAEKLEEFKNQFADADEKMLVILSGLIEEAFDCKEEIAELKENLRELKERNARFTIVAKRERLLTQKRASYVNMMSRLCKYLCTVSADIDESEGLDDYE